MTPAAQLSLFTKRKAARPQPAPEFATHCMVADLLRNPRCLAPNWLWFHVPNGGERPAFVNKNGKRVSIEGGRLQRMGVKPGVSDFILVAPNGGRIHALELKARGEKPSEAQMQFMAAVEAAGGEVAWADSFNAAVTILKDWGAVKVRL
jgi:hypothetical protein